MEKYNYDDVEVLPLNQETPQLCRILYDDEYKNVMGTLLSLMHSKEYSERAFALSESALDLLASHYSIWIYRFDIVVNLHKDLVEELDWCEQVALENEKNYQIWNYRQLLINKIVENGGNFNPHREFPIIQSMLESDAKNHHVWSYRKWLVEKFALYNDVKELQFIDDCLTKDIRNNSAWSHRFIIKFSQTSSYKESQQIVDDEIEYTKTAIEQSPQNPSSWNYLRGIYNKFALDYCNLESFILKFVDLKNITQDNENVAIKSTFALEILAQIFLLEKKYDDSIEVYKMLGLIFDPIRKNYWQYQINKVQSIAET
jgi:protein farnesyltransferase/geranylgeranyltransferase type-1 subunit alpha